MSWLPAKFQSELELTRIVSGAGLTGGARGSRQGIAELVDGENIGVVEEVKAIGDKVKAEALAKVDALGNAHIKLEKHRHCKSVAAEISGAA